MSETFPSTELAAFQRNTLLLMGALQMSPAQRQEQLALGNFLQDLGITDPETLSNARAATELNAAEISIQLRELRDGRQYGLFVAGGQDAGQRQARGIVLEEDGSFSVEVIFDHTDNTLPEARGRFHEGPLTGLLYTVGPTGYITQTSVYGYHTKSPEVFEPGHEGWPKLAGTVERRLLDAILCSPKNDATLATSPARQRIEDEILKPGGSRYQSRRFLHPLLAQVMTGAELPGPVVEPPEAAPTPPPIINQ